MSRLFSLIKKDIRPEAGKKVIASEDFTSLLSASEILAKAQEDVDSLLKKMLLTAKH
ncbi:MAG: hypothetical protein LVR00_06545 [Rhabdochlamydiaceae bacterium]|jgi:hypothetical protein